MPEKMNIEIAHKLAETEAGPNKAFRAELVEIAEAVVLALIAIATAWSGYQAAKWDGRQALLYGTSSRLRVEAAVAATEGGQQRLMDVMTFNTWIQAHETNDQLLADLYLRRFSPEYRVAFDAWLKTEPFTKPDQSPGPALMPEYHNALLEKSAETNQEATTAFTDGTNARATSEIYVRGGVLLATILFLIALAQRFKIHNVRVGLLLVAAALTIFAIVSMATYPQACKPRYTSLIRVRNKPNESTD